MIRYADHFSVKAQVGRSLFDRQLVYMISPMELNALMTRIDELQAEIDALRPLKPEQEQRIFQKFRLDWNFHSNAIEGNQVSLGETQIFLQYGLTAKGKPFKDYLDIRGHNEAIDFLMDLIRQKEPLTEVLIRELHKVLLVEPYKVDAITSGGKPTTKTVKVGEYKSLPNHVRTPTGEIHYYATPEETPAKMGDLVGWFRQATEKRELHPVVIAALFHHRFVAIHPFDDGNGRLTRLLMNLILMRSGFPPVIIRAQRRNDYIFALGKADLDEPDEFVRLVAEELIHSQELYLRGAKGEPVEELDDIDKEIRLLKQELRHLADPIQLTPETQRDIIELSVIPLLDRFISKLSQFDEFYLDREISAVVDWRDEDISSAESLRNLEKEAVSSTIRTFKTDFEILPKIQVAMTWKYFKMAPLSPFDDEVQIVFQFEQLRFSIDVPQAEFKSSHVYGEPLVPSVIDDVVNLACKHCLETIRQNTTIKM